MVSRLCLVRHGETDWNVERRLQGHRDIPLNAQGFAQARQTARVLAQAHFDACYSSDLQRAWQTTTCILEGMQHPPPHIETGTWLRERHYGLFQGLTPNEAADQHPSLWARMKAREPDFAPPGDPESLRVFTKRIECGLDQIRITHAGQAVLAVTHGGVLDAVYRLAMRKPLEAPRDFPIPNAALNWLSWNSTEGWIIETWAQEPTQGAKDELCT
jgi:2,3-bisphosphoglycerate-dependent phosphoglycerate mutase